MTLRTILLAFVTLFACPTAEAQLTDWESMGLEVAWEFQVPTNIARSGPLHVTSYVSGEKKRRVYEVSYEGGPTTVFTAGQVDRSGTVLDDAGAARLADIELRTLKAFGHDDAAVTTREVPHVAMLVQTGAGQLLLLDGETGLLDWSIDVGRYDLTSQLPAISEHYVAAIKGSMLYIIDVAQGEVQHQHRLRGIPDAGPAVADQRVIVPTLQGPLEIYSLKEDEIRRPPTFKTSYGRITGPPVVTPESVAWATDRGFLFLADRTAATPTTRIEARQGIVGAPTFIPPDSMVVAVEDGYVLAVDLKEGQVQWEFFTGQSLAESPYALGGMVYVPSEQNSLFALDSEIGQLKWFTRGVARVLAGAGDQLFCQAPGGQLVALDTTSGQITGSVDLQLGDRLLSNKLTDRLYVVRRSGRIECVRAQGARWPTLHLPLPKVAAEDAETAGEAAPVETAAPEQATPATDTIPDDPFAVDSDEMTDEQNPFAEQRGDSDMSGDEDPFGSGDEADPFGSSDDEDPFATGADEDPFAAGSDEDPFGT